MLAIQWGFSDPARRDEMVGHSAGRRSARLPRLSPWAHGRTRIQQRPANGSALTMAPAVIRRCKTSLQCGVQRSWRRRSRGSRRFPIPNFGPPPNSKSPVTGCGKNPQAATTWIQNSSLPPEERTRLLTPSPEDETLDSDSYRGEPCLRGGRLVLQAKRQFSQRFLEPRERRHHVFFLRQDFARPSPNEIGRRSPPSWAISLPSLSSGTFTPCFPSGHRTRSQSLPSNCKPCCGAVRRKPRSAAFFKTWASTRREGRPRQRNRRCAKRTFAAWRSRLSSKCGCDRRQCLLAHSINDLPPGASSPPTRLTLASSAVTKWSSPSRWPRRNSWMQSTPKALIARVPTAVRRPIGRPKIPSLRSLGRNATSRRLRQSCPARRASTAGGKGSKSRQRLAPLRCPTLRAGRETVMSFADVCFSFRPRPMRDTVVSQPKALTPETPIARLPRAGHRMIRRRRRDGGQLPQDERRNAGRRSGAVLGERRSESAGDFLNRVRRADAGRSRRLFSATPRLRGLRLLLTGPQRFNRNAAERRRTNRERVARCRTWPQRKTDSKQPSPEAEGAPARS